MKSPKHPSFFYFSRTARDRWHRAPRQFISLCISKCNKQHGGGPRAHTPTYVTPWIKSFPLPDLRVFYSPAAVSSFSFRAQPHLIRTTIRTVVDGSIITLVTLPTTLFSLPPPHSFSLSLCLIFSIPRHGQGEGQREERIPFFARRLTITATTTR